MTDSIGFSDRQKMLPLIIANKTIDAYSADCWGPVLWVQAAEMLLNMDFSEAQTEWILRSKNTRWARDAWGDPSTFLGQLAHLSNKYRAEIIQDAEATQ